MAKYCAAGEELPQKCSEKTVFSRGEKVVKVETFGGMTQIGLLGLPHSVDKSVALQASLSKSFVGRRKFLSPLQRKRLGWRKIRGRKGTRALWDEEIEPLFVPIGPEIKSVAANNLSWRQEDEEDEEEEDEEEDEKFEH